MKCEREVLAPNQTRKHVGGPGFHASTGVMLFNTSGQLLFMNDQVPGFFQRLQPASTREFGTCLIPEEISVMVRELTARLRASDHSNECWSILRERMLDISNERLIIRGLCLSSETAATKCRLLIVLETVRPSVASPETKIQDRYHLTEREQMVIIYLMLGFTNKEIANRLNLSEHTVKEHLKRLMQKTQTTTRTGLLACMIFPPSERGARLEALPVQSPLLRTLRAQEALTTVG